MTGSIALVFITAFFFVWLRRRSRQYLLAIEGENRQALQEYGKLNESNARLKRENHDLKKTLESTVALYDITKLICRNLDETKLFNSFSQEMDKYIKADDVKFIKGDIDAEAYKDHTVIPLKIDTNHIGYLAASGIAEQDSDRFNILANQFLLGIRRSMLYQQVQELAIMDGLTGILSRRYFLERFAEELERSRQFNYPLSFVMIDIDHFKDYNDRYGHLVGDVILREVARTIKESLRQIDLIGRYGGEEFAVVLTETDREGALFAAERIRQALEVKVIKAYDENLKVTLSVGISMFPAQGQAVTALIEKSDQALYKAKESGRNRVCVYEYDK